MVNSLSVLWQSFFIRRIEWNTQPNGTSSIQFRQPQPTLQICSLCCASLAVRPRLARPPDLQTGLNCAKTEAGAAVWHCTPVWASSSAQCPEQSAGGSSVTIIMTSGEDLPIDDLALLQLFKDNLLNSTLSTASGITAADVTMLLTPSPAQCRGVTGCPRSPPPAAAASSPATSRRGTRRPGPRPAGPCTTSPQVSRRQYAVPNKDVYHL